MHTNDIEIGNLLLLPPNIFVRLSERQASFIVGRFKRGI